MKKKLIGIMLMSVATVVAVLGMAIQGASTANALEASQDNCKVVKHGDTLLKLFGKGSEKFVTLNGSKLKNPNLIIPGQRLCAKASGTKTVFSGSAKKQAIKPAEKNGEFRWTNVGGAPLTGCGGKTDAVLNEEAWAKLGLTEGEKKDLRAMVMLNEHRFTFLFPGQKYLAVAFCEKGQVSFKQNVLTSWSWSSNLVVLARTYVLKSGKKLHWVRNCGNWVLDAPEAPPPVITETKPVPPPAPVVELPPVVTPPETESPPPPSVPVKSSGICAHQVDAYTGAGKVWSKDSHYGYIGFDWYVKQWSFIDECGETHRLGFGADYAVGSGQTGTDGTFRWDAITLRPVAYKYTGTDGKTLRLRILITRARDGVKADMDRYQNERTIFEWGPEAIFTDQGRKDSGHKWFSEHRASVAVLFAFNKSGSHSWEGTPITDTAELLKVKGMIRAGARLYIYDLDGGQRVFVQAGLAAQWPNVARSLGVSVGLDGPDELWTVFIGPNFDLKEHTHSFGVEVSLQIGKAYLYFRGLAAQSGLLSAVECIESDGNAYFPSTGVLVSGTCPKDTATGATPISASQ